MRMNPGITLWEDDSLGRAIAAASQNPGSSPPRADVVVYRTQEGRTGFDADPQARMLLARLLDGAWLWDRDREVVVPLTGQQADLPALRKQVRPEALVVHGPDEIAHQWLQQAEAAGVARRLRLLNARYGRPGPDDETPL